MNWFRQLDELLRGQRTGSDSLRRHTATLSVRTFLPTAIAAGAVYGFFMGWYSLGVNGAEGIPQLIASTIKLPALFVLTLAITFPSLYVFGALAGTTLTFSAMFRLLIAAMTVTLAVAASFGAILGFFTLSTESYAFMQVLNVALLGVAGFVGLAFLVRALTQAGIRFAMNAVDSDENLDDAGPRSSRAVWMIIAIWLIVYSLVGAQMGWLLRPFIGHPDMPFQIFRQREGNFFQAVFGALSRLLGA